jgi:antitoxin component YwqK of YwqJK toxin-antitoxin module
MNNDHKEKIRLSTIYVTAGLFIAIAVISYHLNREVERVAGKKPLVQDARKEQPASKNDPEKQVKEAGPKADRADLGNVVRTTRKKYKKGGYYTESMFTQGKKIVARYEEFKGKIRERYGRIPDGKVEFVDHVAKTRGEEVYLSGKKHGKYVEYFDTGTIKKEIQYHQGSIMKIKEYYLNGVLRAEQEFLSARLSDMLDREESKGTQKGKGKIYSANGMIEREWDFDNLNGAGYVKIYDAQGYLKDEKNYDTNGNLIENIEGIENTENIENLGQTGNIEITDNLEEAGSGGNIDNIENADIDP